MRSPSPWIISLSVRLYRWLLFMGPAEFRNEYGESAVQVFRECCHDAYQHRGIWGVIGLWPSMFGDAIIGMLAERFSALQYRERCTPQITLALAMRERAIPMYATLRRTMITIFCAFVLFGLAWLSFSRLNDPLSWWNPIVRIHPEVNTTFRVIMSAGEFAFLMILVGGLPIIASATKQAFAARQRDVLLLFGLAVLMILIFVVEVILTISWQWWHAIDPNGGFFAILSLIVLIVVTVALSRAVARGETSLRVLRFALVPATGVTIAMGVSAMATIVETVLFFTETPQVLTSSDMVMWVIADLIMTISMGVALVALRRGLRARTLTPA